VVDRYFRVKNFVPETFWRIDFNYKKDNISVNFSWSRGHLFDRMAVVIIYEMCLNAKTAKVSKVQTRPTSRWRPLPLTTVELQKNGSRYLRINSHQVMKVSSPLIVECLRTV
jgi:DNA topoisomerase-3